MNGVLALFAGCKLLLLLSSIFSGTILRFVLALIFGEKADQALQEFASYATPSGVFFEIALFVLILFVPICIYFFFSGKRFSETVPQEKPELLQVCFGVGSTVVIGYVFGILGNNVLAILFRLFGMEDKLEAMLSGDVAYPSNFWLILPFAIMLSVLPGFFEEILMRGIGLSVTKRYGVIFALLFSGFFFSLMHSSWTQLIFTFVIGIVLAYFTLRFKTIWIAVISHFIFNFNTVVQSLILQNGSDDSVVFIVIWFLLFMSLMLGLAIAGLILYGVKMPPQPKYGYHFGDGVKAMLCSPFLYIFLVLEAIQLIFLLLIY